MRFAILFLFMVSIVSLIAYSDEPNSFKTLYENLQNEPSQMEMEEFTRSLNELLHPNAQAEADFSADPLKTALAFLGIAGCDKDYILAATKRVITDTTQFIPPYKAWIMLASLFRCTLACKPEPADESDKLMAASAILMHIWMSTLLELRIQSGDKGDCFGKYCELLASISAEYDFDSHFDAIIDDMAASLPYDVNDKWSGLEDWVKSVDSRTLNMVQLAAHLQWLYRTFTIEECLCDEIPEKVDGNTTMRMGRIVLLVANSRYMTATEQQIENTKGIPFGSISLFLRTIRIALPVLKLQNNSDVGDNNKIGRSNALLRPHLSYFNLTYFVPSSYRSLLCEWKLKEFELSYGLIKKSVYGSVKLEKVAEGVSGPAWFRGSQKLEYGILRKIETDFVYPLVFVECYEDIHGFDWMIGLYPAKYFRSKLMAQVDGYIWDPLKHSPETCYLADSVDVNAEFKCGLDNELDDLLADPWKDIFLKGLAGINPAALSSAKVPTMFDPAPFYYCDKTVYTVYEVWEYDQVVGDVRGKRPVSVLCVRPADDAKVTQTKAGLIYNVINHWYMNSLDLPIKFKSWPLVLFRESQKSLFDQVHARNANIRATFDEDYAKSMEKYNEKKRKLLGGN